MSNDYESDLASLCDYINTFAREKGTYQAPDYTLSAMKVAIDGVIFAVAEERNAQERAKRSVVEALDNLIGAGGYGGEGEFIIEEARDLIRDAKKAIEQANA